jgi:hypothetical protein
MAECFYCGAETRLYEQGTPICLECDRRRALPRLQPEHKPDEEQPKETFSDPVGDRYNS